MSVNTKQHTLATPAKAQTELATASMLAMSLFLGLVVLATGSITLWRMRRGDHRKAALHVVMAIGIVWLFIHFWPTALLPWVIVPALLGGTLAFYFRPKAKTTPQQRTEFGNATMASREEVDRAGYVMRYDEKQKSFFGESGIPLGSFYDLAPRPPKRFRRFDPQYLDPWGDTHTLHPNWLRYSGQAHLITVAPARSGKGRDILIPALLDRGLGSCVVIDPKGQLAAVTARYRASLGFPVYCVNPFDLHKGLIPVSVGCNPMDSLDPTTASFGVDCDSMADAIVRDTGGDRHFSESARTATSGVIMYFAMFGDASERNLATVQSVISGPPSLFQAVVDKAMRTGNMLLISRLSRFAEPDPEDREARSILSTARTQTAFLSNDAIASSVRTTGISAIDLRAGATVYLILPGEYLDACGKWFRLVIDTLLRDLLKHAEGAPVTFVLDEFANLGHLASVETAMALSAGYNLRMWPILQDLNQLKNLYESKWETFLANSGVQQFFAPRDMTTAEYISRRAGKRTMEVASSSFREISKKEARDGYTGQSTSVNVQQADLLMPQDVLGMSDERQILFMQGVSNPVLGKRMPYWEIQDLAGRFDPDPYHR